MAVEGRVLLIMTDQQRFDSLGAYGADAVNTPSLDRLASQGVLFEHAYAANPICTPSRASLLTGRRLPGHGVYRLYDNLPDDQVLFSERLQQAGYRTALFGKLHVSGRLYESVRRHPHDGFDVYEWCLEPSLHMDSPFNGYARWLRERNPEFYDRLARERRELRHIPRELHMTHWAAERTIEVGRVLAALEEKIFRTGSYPDPAIHATMLRDERYKLNVYLDDEEAGRLDGQLFDMREDPRELVELWDSPDHAQERERLLRALVDWETRQELLLGSRGGERLPAPTQRLDNRLNQN